MTPVARNPRIFWFECRVDAGGHRFLSVIQVTKSPNGTGLVFIVARDFHTTHSVHQFKVREELLLRHVDGIVWLSFEVVCFEGSGEVEGGGAACRGGGGLEAHAIPQEGGDGRGG